METLYGDSSTRGLSDGETEMKLLAESRSSRKG
jgi:hypothetical protein